MLAQNVLSLPRGSRYREGRGKGCKHRTASRFFPRAMSFPSWSARMRPRLPSRIWRRRFLVLRTTGSLARTSSTRPWNIRSTTSSATRPARCRSPTSSPPAPRRRTSCSSATRCSSPSRSRACTPAARASRRSTSCSTASPPSRPTGIVFLPLEHDGNSQRSTEEAELVKALYASLLEQRFRSKQGEEHPMGADNILVVAPYNSQVNLLRSVLPSGARVGTIDKFQGQEAEAVLISMSTSSGDYLPRNIEFLYDKNRLNVAISRAKCLSLVVASTALMHIKCRTPEQMALVNTLCWLQKYGHVMSASR